MAGLEFNLTVLKATSPTVLSGVGMSCMKAMSGITTGSETIVLAGLNVPGPLGSSCGAAPLKG